MKADRERARGRRVVLPAVDVVEVRRRSGLSTYGAIRLLFRRFVGFEFDEVGKCFVVRF